MLLLFAASVVASHHLRIGDLIVCRRNLVGVSVLRDPDVNQWRLNVTVTAAAARMLAQQTSARVGRPLIVRVGGREIARAHPPGADYERQPIDHLADAGRAWTNGVCCTPPMLTCVSAADS